jgi:hypothetical protein
MSPEPIVGYKRSAPDVPVTSDDDGSQPERGKEAEAAGPKLDHAERQRNKKLSRDGEARNLSQEERKMTVITRQIEETEQKASQQNEERKMSSAEGAGDEHTGDEHTDDEHRQGNVPSRITFDTVQTVTVAAMDRGAERRRAGGRCFFQHGTV